jgi:putative DNA primase/helicase
MTRDIDQAQRFLALLDSDSAPHEWHYRAICPSTRKDLVDAGKSKNLASLEALLAKNLAGYGAFVVVNAGGHDTEKVSRVRALYVDFDEADDHLSRVSQLVPFEPGVIVESSPGKHHVYWLVDGLPVAEFKRAQQKLIALLGSDTSVHDLPRVMRLPGFVHTKSKGHPFVTRMTHESGQRYEWAEFAAWLDKLPDPKARSNQSEHASVGADHLAQLQELLQFIPNTAATDYEQWQTVCAAIHHETNGTREGYALAVQWSAKSPKHDESDMPKKWASFGGYDKPATMGTLKMLAKAGGWNESASLMSRAQALTEDSASDTIQSIVVDAYRLNPADRDRILKRVKAQSGIALGTLREMFTGSDEGQLEGGPDHLEIARQVVDKLGSENLLGDPSGVWAWSQSGVWSIQDERSVRQWTQASIEGAADVTKSLVDSVTDLFKTEIHKPAHEFDIGPPECVNALNGEVYLHDLAGTWALEPHNREHYRTTQIPVTFDRQATAPRFEQFLGEVFKDDKDASDKRRAVLEMMGYSLMAHCRHERFVIMVGTGANGKSVILSVLEALLGKVNVSGVQPSQFDRSFQRAHLHGKLANIVTEIKQGEVIDDASLKGIVSGEPTTVEHKFKDPFVMRPFATCWFGTNHLPHTRDFSDALFRRALIIEFNQVFKPELGNCDPLLKDKLIDELPGVLNLALAAYADALEYGFTMPASCKAARESWRLEADQVAQFVEAECVVDPLGTVEPGKLFNAYRDWASECGISKTVALRSFTDRLRVLNYKAAPSNGRRIIRGLRCDRISFGGFP